MAGEPSLEWGNAVGVFLSCPAALPGSMPILRLVLNRWWDYPNGWASAVERTRAQATHSSSMGGWAAVFRR
jgi:hypothetical protein